MFLPGFRQCARLLQSKVVAANQAMWRHTPSRAFSPTALRASQDTVKVTYIEPDGTERVVSARVGQHLLDLAHENDIELEGACGGELACSTCHLIFEQDIFDTLPEMEEDEEDMLDLAFEVTETSRLGCQIQVRPDMDGMIVRIPDDGF
eukprot:Nitzschia sp. Nitz4//scaffold85_size83877//18582//19257//NITZ4_005220-RA/size83877-augustus-gene-0.147-mRNA-1//1//CDS//3329559110//7500//frame0